jgi:cation diffusion facilitator family transporter
VTTSVDRGRRVALLSVLISLALATSNVLVGVLGGSTSVVAIGAEFAGDVLASCVVFVGLLVASRPADANHPYGHGRLETVAGLLVGFILVAGGVGIGYRSLAEVGASHPPPAFSSVYVLVIAIAVRGVMSVAKFRLGRTIGSSSLTADAWNDAVDVLSASAALTAVLLARFDPARFLAADHYGGFAVGLVVILTGVRVVRDASLDLADTMPDPVMMAAVVATAARVPGVVKVEKHVARKTGLRYHLDLHIEVDPDMTVRASHAVAHDVKARIQTDLPWVADVLVHVEPAGGVIGER